MNHFAIPILMGLIVSPLLGGLIVGMDRVITARVQGRIGPPVLQPFFDVVKLLGKQMLVVNVWQAFCAYAYLVAAVISLVLFFMQSDLLLIFFIQAVGAVFLVVGALSSTSPFSQVGAHRELLQMLTYEPLLVLMIAGIYLLIGSFRIDAVYAWPRPLIFKLPFHFVTLFYALTIKLRKSPFDLSTSHHGHQELVKGVLTDYSGPLLALIEVGHWLEILLLLGFCSLFWATHWLGMLLLVLITCLMEILIDNITARMTWRWMLGYVWAMGLTLATVNLIWLTLA